MQIFSWQISCMAAAIEQGIVNNHFDVLPCKIIIGISGETSSLYFWIFIMYYVLEAQ